jgi:hypothetical protein
MKPISGNNGSLLKFFLKLKNGKSSMKIGQFFNFKMGKSPEKIDQFQKNMKAC